MDEVKTPVLNLALTPVDSGSKTFRQFRTEIAGTNPESAMMVIDGAIGELQDGLEAISRVVDGVSGSKVDGAYVEDGYLYLTSNNEIVAGPLGPFSGTGGGSGGGGSSNNAVLTVTNGSGWLSKTIGYGSVCNIVLSWSSTEDDIPTGNGMMKITVNGVSKATIDVVQGNVVRNITQYLSAGTNVVKVTISDVYGNSRTITYTVNAIDVSISSTFDASTPFSGAITFPYTPVGNIQKTVHILLDGEQLDTVTTTASGRQMTYLIPQQPHGAHSIEIYFTAEIDEQEIESNRLYYEVVCIDTTSTEPIIISPFLTTTAAQYTSLVIPYTVYSPSSFTSPILLTANGSTVASLTVDRTEQSWTYRAYSTGELTLSIVCGSVEKKFSLTITESDVHVEAETDSLSLYLSSYGRSNNEDNPGVWEYGNIEATFSGFNFESDGWRTDDDGISVLRVVGDARLTIPIKPFASDFRVTGKTIEFEFATRNVLDYDATILSCASGGRGITITPQFARMSSEQSEISTQYKEDEHVRISFVVEKRSEQRLMYIYINGIMSGVARYPTNDDFSQATPVNISVGSSDATIDLYAIRIYDNDLTRHQILSNWIADTQNVDDLLARYERNDIFDAYSQIVIDNLPADLPYMILEGAELPQYKGDKKTVSGTYTDPANPSKSFTFTGAQADVQGTSSQGYARKNYKIKFNNGFTLANGTQSAKYAMRDGAIPVNTFTFKADVASSEGCNNVELVRLYNEACPYKTPPQQENPAVRQGIDGFPIVIFWDDGENTTFLGKYNFNNDKGTENVYGFVEGDESWEILNNTSDRVLWKSDDYSGSDWLSDFEGRFPDGNTDGTNLAALAAWLVTTDQEAATGDTLDEAVEYDGVSYDHDTAAYRLAKFKAEFTDHFEKDAVIFYYLFTEIFLMVDSRAKNAFPTFMSGSKWFSLPYDMDTAIGI